MIGSLEVKHECLLYPVSFKLAWLTQIDLDLI